MFSFYTLWKCGYRKETLIWNGLKGYHNCTASFSRVWLRLFQTLLMVILGLRDGENSDNVSGSGEAYRTFFGQSLHKTIIIINHIIIKYQIYSDSETKVCSPHYSAVLWNFSERERMSTSTKKCTGRILFLLDWKPFKSDENLFYFILKALFILKISKFSLRLFGHVGKMDWLER